VIVVVDTNILVSGLLSPRGPSAMILDGLMLGKLHACYDARILAEYEKVLLRPRFAFDRKSIDLILKRIAQEGTLVACAPVPVSLPDADDNKFVEAALAGSAQCIVTGNLKHYPTSRCFGIPVETPANFVRRRDFP